MKRRTLLKGAGVAAVLPAAVALPRPAIAQGQAEAGDRPRTAGAALAARVKLSQKPRHALRGGAHVAKRVAAMTDNRWQIQVFAAGEIVGGAQVLDAVQSGTVECGHTLSNFYVGKDPTFAFDSCLPFGLNARQQIAWMQRGGASS
jgi:TRAP-type mannitol/chloroaromatic compound transport system substrate-binding protein